MLILATSEYANRSWDIVRGRLGRIDAHSVVSLFMRQAANHFFIRVRQLSTFPGRQAGCMKVILVDDVGIWFAMFRLIDVVERSGSTHTNKCLHCHQKDTKL